MKKVSLSLFMAVLFAVTIFGRQDTAFAQTNILQNPSFEEPYVGGAAGSWGRWHEDTGKKPDCAERYSVEPKWSPELNGALILDGSRSQHVGNQFDTWRGGVVQDVAVTAGTTYRFSSFAWGRTTNEQYPAPSDRAAAMRVRVGIDPTGSGLWTSGSIVWSGTISPHDNWEQVAVEATASGNTISVFIEADFTGANQCRAHLDIWYDRAELVEVGPPPTATSPPAPTAAPVVVQPTQPPPPTNTPEPTVVPTDTPVPSPTPIPPSPTPTGSTICINAFADANANGANDANEGYMAGVRFTVARGSEIIGEGVSPGTDNAVCFEGLPAGSYQIAQTVPDTLEMTTAGNITIDLSDGQPPVGLEFGTRVKQQEQPSTNTTTTDNTGTEGEAVAANTGSNTEAAPAAETGDGTPAEDAGGSEFGLMSIIGLVVIGLAILLLIVLIGLVAFRR